MLRLLILAAVLLTCVQLPGAQAQPRPGLKSNADMQTQPEHWLRYFRPSNDGMSIRSEPAITAATYERCAQYRQGPLLTHAPAVGDSQRPSPHAPPAVTTQDPMPTVLSAPSYKVLRR